MQREIEFRAWSNTLGMSDNFTLKDVVNSDIKEFETYLQFTGMRDKNGKKIFEGDIIQFVFDKSLIREVLFWPPMAGFCTTEKANDFGFPTMFPLRIEIAESIQVIGNKFENPELLANNKQ